MEPCPHGHVAIAACPECSRFMNVKPIREMARASFVEFTNPVKEEDENLIRPAGDDLKDPLNHRNLMAPRRLQKKDDLGISIPHNSTLLHHRLEQLGVSKSPLMQGEFSKKIEARLHQVRGSRFNPRASLE